MGASSGVFIFVFTLLCGLYMLISINNSTNMTIYVSEGPTSAELMKIIKQQQEYIQYILKHPKIVVRNVTTGGKILRYADDNLTMIDMSTKDDCADAANYSAVVLVHTAARHFYRRQRIRSLYGDFEKTKPWRLKLVFLLGSVLDIPLQQELESENRLYGDTVSGYFLDTYHNLTLKAVMGYRWVAENCKGIRLLLKMDDDVLLNVRRFFTTYWSKVHQTRKRKSIHCTVWRKTKVRRQGKWGVDVSLYNEPVYHFPYCGGYLAIVTPDLIQPMYTVGKNMPFFWIDDVFLYGMVPDKIGNVSFFNVGGKRLYSSSNYTDLGLCQRKKKENCQMWAVVPYNDTHFEDVYQSFLQPNISNPGSV